MITDTVQPDRFSIGLSSPSLLWWATSVMNILRETYNYLPSFVLCLCVVGARRVGTALDCLFSCSPATSIRAPVCSYSFSIFSLITYIICSDMHLEQLKHAVIKAGCGWGPGEVVHWQFPTSRWQWNAIHTLTPPPQPPTHSSPLHQPPSPSSPPPHPVLPGFSSQAPLISCVPSQTLLRSTSHFQFKQCVYTGNVTRRRCNHV